MDLVTTEVVAVGLNAAALFACSFVAGMRRPHAGRLAATAVVAVVALVIIVLAAGMLVAGDPGNPDSIAGPVGATFLVIGLLVGGLALAAQLGGEVGRWLAAAGVALVGTLVLWATVSEPIQEDTASGSMVLMLLGLSFIACAALLVGGATPQPQSPALPRPS